MKLKNTRIKNFRLLVDCNFELERDLNIVIGKNNTGKTSMLFCFDKFINYSKTNSFRYEDLSLKLQDDIEKIILDESLINESDYQEELFGISLDLKIIYDENDNISELSKLITDLSSEKNEVNLCFRYFLSYPKYLNLRTDFSEFNKKIKKSISWFLTRNFDKYFELKRYGYDVNPNNYILLDSNMISSIIKFSYINAKREVNNDSSQKNLTIRSELSKLSYNYLKNNNSDDELQNKIDELNKKLLEMDSALDTQYSNIFKSFFDDLIDYGLADEGSKLEIQSRLSDINIVQDNTLMLYDIDGKKLPETYNGLGFLNFYALIMQVNSILSIFKRNSHDCINILMIEEPEAHTHPQMQYIFINNIKKIICKYKKNINLCTIITTHSSQIVSQAEYEDLLCFVKVNSTTSEIRSVLKFLKKYKDSDKETYLYLKKYLTLTNSEIFFTDKLIICEGTTERILLPIFIKLCDDNKITNIPLQTQKYTIIESGVYSHKMQPLLDLIGIKTLIITDIDFCKGQNHNKCRYDEATCTSNAIINHYVNNLKIEDLINQNDVMVFENVGLTFQHFENNYHARSFEDAYISLNYDYLKENFSKFKGLKCKKDFLSGDFYEIGNKCIESKSDFAASIAFNSLENFSNIKIPKYIEDGIKWIAE